MLEFQGFYASITYDEGRDQYVGIVQEPNVPIVFGAVPSHGESLHAEFVKAVEEYVDYCDRRNIPIPRWDRLRKVS